jgi:plastocyanin
MRLDRRQPKPAPPVSIKELPPMRVSRALLAAPAVALVLLLSLTGCGGDSNASDTDASTMAPVIIEINEDAGKITPDDGHVVKVAVGQRVQLNVSSDVADEIHVHSEPEHEFEVPAGQDKTFTFTIDTPGTVTIESHGLDVVLVKLEVS